MVRTLDQVGHGVRRDAILDAAEQLIRTKGYERVSIQDVQDALGVSRGAIYHYFGSKAALLEAVAGRAGDQIVALMAPIAEDPDQPAVAKLQAVFSAGGRWKMERRELMLALLRCWYSDENALAREHTARATATRVTPLLAAIICQGLAERSMHVRSAPHAADILMALFTALADRIAQLWLGALDGRVSIEHIAAAVGAYDEAVERILGLTPGSFALIDEPTLRLWFD